MGVMRRRDLFLAVTTAGAAAVLGTACSTTPSAQLTAQRDKRSTPLYQPNSPEVQAFYRVNRYPAK